VRTLTASSSMTSPVGAVAYCEFIGQRAGITVHYCADEFENDGSLASFMIKTKKRIGAADRNGFDLVAP
jgi:hypothetical protein